MEDIQFQLALNIAGRSKVHGGVSSSSTSDHSGIPLTSRSEWVDVLTKATSSASCFDEDPDRYTLSAIYHFLSLNPALCNINP